MNSYILSDAAHHHDSEVEGLLSSHLSSLLCRAVPVLGLLFSSSSSAAAAAAAAVVTMSHLYT